MSNAAQRDFWSSGSGENWVTYQERMDATLAPVLDTIMDRAGLHAGQAVLDIGCGTGASLLRAAAEVGPSGHVLGVDISPVLLRRAKERLAGLAHVTCREDDAAEADLGGPFDAAISRFGVMFFSDTKAAFVNVAKYLRPGAQLTMAAWAPAGENPWWMEPARAARARLGTPPKIDRRQPGPFAWEERDRVTEMLASAGLQDVTVDNTEVSLTPPGSARDAARDSTFIGSARAVINHFGGDEADRQAIEDDLAAVFATFETPAGVRIPARINLVTARVPA